MAQVNDYNIANASGASVRSDLNAVFRAIKTLNSGGTDPSNPEAFMPYVDTADNNNLKIRNSSNNSFTTIGSVNTANLGLLPRSGGTMTGQLLGDDGSVVSSPAYSFDNDTDTGMYRRQSNTIGFATAGTERVIIDSNGINIRERGDLRLNDSDSTHYVGIQSPSTVTTNVVFTLPGADGSSGQVLQTNGSGALSFVSLPTGFSGAASALTGNTLASGVTNSSLTSVGTLGSLTVSGNITANGNIVGDGNTDLNNIDDANIDRGIFNNVESSNYKSRNSSPPVFKNSSNSETSAGRLVRACVEFDSYRGGNASDNYASIKGQFNVSSVTDHSEGQFSANFSSSVPSNATTCGMIDLERFTGNNHCTMYLRNESGAGTGSVRVHICNANNSGQVLDKSSVNIAVFA